MKSNWMIQIWGSWFALENEGQPLLAEELLPFVHHQSHVSGLNMPTSFIDKLGHNKVAFGNPFPCHMVFHVLEVELLEDLISCKIRGSILVDAFLKQKMSCLVSNNIFCVATFFFPLDTTEVPG